MTDMVADSSVLIDLERAILLGPAFQLGHVLAVPDHLYERELAEYTGPQLLEMGLQVRILSEDGVALATEYRARSRRAISLPDAYCLALSKISGHILLTGDKILRTLATAEGVECHGTLWLFDLVEEAGLLGPADLEARLSTLIAAPRGRLRLPNEEVMARMIRYRSRQ